VLIRELDQHRSPYCNAFVARLSIGAARPGITTITPPSPGNGKTRIRFGARHRAVECHPFSTRRRRSSSPRRSTSGKG